MKTENSASHCEYYHAPVTHPSNPGQSQPYVANCEDIIQALGLTFDEGCEFKSIWRRARGRQGFLKAESTALRDAQKAVHYAGRVLALEMRKSPEADRIDMTCEATPSPSLYEWRSIPAQFEWLATNADGNVFAYECRPTQGTAPYWLVSAASATSRRMQHLSAPPCPWHESLEKRP